MARLVDPSKVRKDTALKTFYFDGGIQDDISHHSMISVATELLKEIAPEFLPENVKIESHGIKEGHCGYQVKFPVDRDLSLVLEAWFGLGNSENPYRIIKPRFGDAYPLRHQEITRTAQDILSGLE